MDISKKTKLIYLIILFLGVFASAKNTKAATLNVACSGTITTALQNAIDTATDGTTITIGAGSCSLGQVYWSNKNITITGQACTLDGSGLPTSCPTNIAITGGDSGTFIIYVSDAGGRKAGWRITNLALTNTTSSKTININNSNPSMSQYAGYFRFDHILMNYATTAGNSIHIYGPVYGLMDHLSYTYTGTGYHNFMNQSEYVVDYSNNESQWSSPYTTPPAGPFMGEYSGKLMSPRGTINNVYVEDSKFVAVNTTLACAADSESGGGHKVFRHNTYVGGWFWYAHWSRSDEFDGYWWEIYDNNIDARGWDGYPARFEAGTGVIYNNTFKNYGSNNIILDERRGCGMEATAHNYDCNGTRPQDGNAGDPSAPGWPCMGQVGTGCLSAGGCTRNAMDNVPVILWNNGVQDGCSSGGACTNSTTVSLWSDASCTRTMANYIKKTPHSASISKYNGAVDYSDGNSSMPVTAGTYTNNYVAYTYPHPLQGINPPPTDTNPPAAPSGLTIQ